MVQTGIFEVLGVWLELLRPSSASLIGAEAGVLTSFILNNRYSFGGHSHTPLISRLVRYHIVVSGSLAIQWFCLFITEQGSYGWIAIHGAYIAGILLGFVVNYTGYRLWVWRHHDGPTTATPTQTNPQ